MNVRSLILLIIALVVAGAAALFARSLVNTSQPAQAQAEVVQVTVAAETTDILVAAIPLPVGKLIDAKDMTWKPWPNDGLDAGYVPRENFNEETLLGKVVRHSVVEGEPITLSKLVGPGERGFLAAILGTGMRAVTVPVNQTTGIAGFVFPGDRVDLILTHAVVDTFGKERRASETVLYNVRVLAVDRDTNDLQSAPKVAQTVTLEVTPKIVEMISVLRQLGDLSLSLRSLAGTEAEAQAPSVNQNFFANRPSYTWDADVSALLPEVGEKNSLQISRGRVVQSVTLGEQ